MNKGLILVKIDSKYCDYLRDFDNKVPYNYNKKELRPFIGVLFNIDDIMYFAPLSSPKPKHLKLKNNLDFLKIKNGEMGAINFNNMIPVKHNNIILLDLNLSNKKGSDKKYYKLLTEQLYWLNRSSDRIYKQSKKLYDKYNDGTLENKIKDRCCNFKLLEEKCDEYNK